MHNPIDSIFWLMKIKAELMKCDIKLFDHGPSVRVKAIEATSQKNKKMTEYQKKTSEKKMRDNRLGKTIFFTLFP
jgi:hypothetical protein